MAAGLTAIAAIAAPSADAPVFKSSTVRSARTAFDSAITSARKDFDQKFRSARQRYVDVLETAIKLSTKEGDLAEANKLDLELRTVNAAPYAGSVPVLVGAWRMRWGNQGFTNYTFRDDGTVVRDLRDAATQGSLRRIGDDLMLDFGDQSLMRVNLAGNRLVLEYWQAASSYPDRYPNLFGVGERLAMP